MACYVVGDIHGCLDEMACLVEHLPLEPPDQLIFLGDYIDRGPDSKGVVSYLLEFQAQAQQEIVFLKGNHEDMLLGYFGLPGEHGDMFLLNGGKTTLASYGLSPATASSDEMLSRMPSRHLDFFTELKHYFIMKPFLCVHAGIHPLKSLEDQTESEMLWIRNEFIYNSHRLPYTILFGHTPQKEVLFDLPYKIGLDTGLVYGNKLTCLETSEKLLYQIRRGEKTVKRISLKDKWNQRFSSLTP